jgi:hypothetical protein
VQFVLPFRLSGTSQATTVLTDADRVIANHLEILKDLHREVDWLSQCQGHLGPGERSDSFVGWFLHGISVWMMAVLVDSAYLTEVD